MREILELAQKDILQLAQTIHSNEIFQRVGWTESDYQIYKQVYVKLIEARNLQPHSLNIYTLDPYCIITCEFGYDRSLTIWNNLNPVWDEEYYLYIFPFLPSPPPLSLPFFSPFSSLLSPFLPLFHSTLISFLVKSSFYCEKGRIFPRFYLSSHSRFPGTRISPRLFSFFHFEVLKIN